MHPATRVNRPVLLAIVAALMLTGTAAAAGSTYYVQLYVYPGSGIVCLDNQCQTSTGSITGTGSIRFEDVAGGMDHRIRVYSTPGYQDYTDSIYMSYYGSSVTRYIYLEPSSPPTGNIQVQSNPSGATACIDGTSTCDTTPTIFRDVAAGTYHTVTVSLNGYDTYTEDVWAVANNQMAITADLQRSALKTETLRVYISPGVGQVCLDGADCQTDTGPTLETWPVYFYQVSEDRSHTITVTADGYQNAVVSVTVLPNQMNDVEIIMQPVATGAPTSPPSPVPTAPQPTRAGLPGMLPLIAAGIGGAAFLCRKHGE